MVGNSNSTILTVSYGTFSCTLEGFDDSFETMKAIAEYFRDLAADDRYFGAEPPTPDAEMLARIAEKEASRKVEALSRDGGITLRPYQIEDASSAAPEPKAAPTPVTPDVAEDTASFEEDSEASESFFKAGPSAPTQQETVAARLQRIREAASSAPVEAAAVAAQIADVVEEDIEPTVHPMAQDAPAELDEIVDEEPEVLEVSDENPEDQDASDDALFEALLADDEDAEDVAAHAEELAEDVSEPSEPEADDELDAMLLGLDDEGVEEDEVAESDTDYASDATEVLEDDDAELVEALEDTEAAPIRARVLHVKGGAHKDEHELDEMLYSDDDDSSDPFDSTSLDAIFDDEDDSDDTVETSLSPEDEEDLMRELAEAESADGWDDLLDEDADVEIADEENLFSNDPEEALASAQDLSSLLTDTSADSEMARLMAETETQLSSPDVHRRRATIAHLKAAVASKRADSEAGRVDPDSIDSASYKDDLTDAVKPKRPVVSSAKTERIAQTPLKLVAAQRVVPESPAKEPGPRPTLVKPVRPRRIRATSAALAEAADILHDDDMVANAPAEVAPMDTPKVAFAAYAEHMHVEKLPELLEAAASFVTYVEHLEKFSRPQVMLRVREVMGDDFSREDGLRAFGQLLREGKIIKLDGGRFTVSDTIGFQPE
jgi:hypothetical protein